MSGTVADMVAALGLAPHPEGGFFRETYRAKSTVVTGKGPRAACTAILFLLTTAQPSHFHRLSSDELWIHCGGGVTQLLTLPLAGRAASVLLGSAVQAASESGYQSQAIVSAGDWQAARVVAGDVDWSLVSCVVTPGFVYADFELADRDSLLATYPAAASDILELTR